MKDLKLNKKIKIVNYRNIALIGHMGSGKSVFGKIISKKLNLEHVDSDSFIVKTTNKTIKEIFEIDGEKKFRKIEEETVLSLSIKKNIALSLGGGSILSSKIRDILMQNFFTVFIDTDINDLVERLKNSTKRHLLKKKKKKKKIQELDLKRRKYYLLADTKINNCKNLKEMMNVFLENYKKYNEKNNKN